MRLRLPLLFVFACALVACGESPTSPSATSASLESATGTARADSAGTIRVASVFDMPQPNSCGVDGFKVNSAVSLAYTRVSLEMRPGPGITVWEAQWQGPRTNVTGQPNTFDGTPVVPQSDASPYLDRAFTVNGMYRVRMRGRGCATWTEWAEFTIGGYPEQAPTPPVAPPIED